MNRVFKRRAHRAPASRTINAAIESLEPRRLFDSKLGDIFYIALENHNFTQPATDASAPQQLLGNPAAPYLNSLITPGNPNAAQRAYASAYHNVLATPSGNNPSIHPSEPNYIWAEAGSNLGTANDADPYTGAKNVFAGPDLTGLIQSAGYSWKSYQEDIDLTPTAGSVNFPGPNSLTSTVAPQGQWTVPTKSFSGTSAAYTNPYNGSHQYDFAVKHDGQLFFTDTNGGTLTAPNTSPSNPETLNYAPMQQLATDLANNTVARYNWITPNQFNDMHSALKTDFTYNGTTYLHGSDAQKLAMGDNFLSVVVPQIMASAAYKNNGAIVIWNDETEGTNANDFSHTSTKIVISPLAKGNAYNSTVNYTHSSDVKTWQEVFGVHAPGGGFLGDANTAGTNDLRDLFKRGVISPGVLVLNGGGKGLSVTGGATVNPLHDSSIVVNSDPSTATPDPLALPLPAMPANTFSNVQITGDTTLSPGTYIGGISVSGHSNVTLLPGLYYMLGGGFTVDGHASVSGNGVLLVNAPQNGIRVDGQASLTLSAPTHLTGALAAYNGIAIFDSGAPIEFGGQSDVSLTGTLYAPDARLDLSGSASFSDTGSGGIAGIIVDELNASGHSKLIVDF